MRLVLHTAVLADAWRARRDPQTNPLAKCEFATIRERLIKIAARVIEHVARIRVQLPTTCPDAALSGMSHSASCLQVHKPRGCVPRRAADTVDQPRTRCITSCLAPISPDGSRHASARLTYKKVPLVTAIALAYCWRQLAEAIWAASVGSVRNPPSISTDGTVASLRTAKRARFTPRSKEAQDTLIEGCRQNQIDRFQRMAVFVLAVMGLRLPLSGWWRAFGSANLWQLHHAAPFAAVRWTNIHDPALLVILGDLISGPIAPIYGPGVIDVDLRRLRGQSLRFSHTRYWSMQVAAAPPHVAVLRDALDLAGQRLL